MGGDALVLRPLHHIGYGDGAAVVGAIESSGALPPGYVLETSGMMEMMDEAIADFGEAMCLAVEDQFRPVLMVVLSSGLGMLPIALSNGIGSENRVGMGVASVAGIIVAGVLTITALPLIFNAFAKKR